MVVNLTVLESMTSRPFVYHVSSAWSGDFRIGHRMIPGCSPMSILTGPLARRQLKVG